MFGFSKVRSSPRSTSRASLASMFLAMLSRSLLLLLSCRLPDMGSADVKEEALLLSRMGSWPSILLAFSLGFYARAGSRIMSNRLGVN